jgi:hypothetical protein
MNMNCHSELDYSQLVDAEGIAHYHMMTGSVNWAIALGRHDIQHAVSALLSATPCNNNNHVAAPPYHHEGHYILVAVMTSISGYLKNFPAKNDHHWCTDHHAAKDCSVKRRPEQEEQVQATTSLICCLMPLLLAARMIHIFNWLPSVERVWFKVNATGEGSVAVHSFGQWMQAIQLEKATMNRTASP